MKEQAAGLYAQTMAERGFVALAFDPSYNGDSGGEPRRSSSPEIFTEDFSAAVDFLGTRPFLDRDRIGVIGICGSGGFALSAAQVDRRIRAVGTSVMYDISLAHAHGFKDAMCEDQRNAVLDQIGAQRWRQFEGARVALTPRGAPETVDDSTDPIAREFYEYYSTQRGQHPNSVTPVHHGERHVVHELPQLTYIRSISPRPILFVVGEHAHSRYFAEDAYQAAAEPKELYVVPGAGHVDLYDKVDLIPFDNLEDFFTRHLR